MVGGRDYRETQLNHAVQTQRQPGSAFKPFVWSAALDGNMTQASIIDDDRVAFYNDGRDWKLLESATDSFALNRASPLCFRRCSALVINKTELAIDTPTDMIMPI